jgi:hypothetical protein
MKHFSPKELERVPLSHPVFKPKRPTLRDFKAWVVTVGPRTHIRFDDIRKCAVTTYLKARGFNHRPSADLFSAEYQDHRANALFVLLCDNYDLADHDTYGELQKALGLQKTA